MPEEVEMPEEKTEEVIEDETAELAPSEVEGWKTYRNEEYGFEFQYPKDWGEINLEQQAVDEPAEHFDYEYKRVIFEAQMKVGVYTFFLDNKKIKKIWYQPSSESLAFVEYGEEEYEAVDSRDIRKQETLKIIGSKGEITQIYTVPENIVPWYGKIGAVRFSLGGNYVCFIEDGWENTKLMIVNVQTKKNILKDIDSWFNRLDIYQNIFWSQNEKVLAIKSYWSSFSGEGRDGIFVSDYGKPEKLNQVFTFGEGFKAMEFEDGSEIYNIRLMSDEKLYFSVKFAPYEGETYEKKYEYIVKTKELKEVK